MHRLLGVDDTDVAICARGLSGILELFHTMSFFAQGLNSPHYQYHPQMDACINDAYQLGMSLPHSV